MGGKEGRLVREETVEDVKGLHGVLLVVVLDGLLEDLDHAGDGVLEALQGLDVLIGVEDHDELGEGQHGVGADLDGLGVLDGLVEQLKHLRHVLLEGVGRGLEQGVDDVDTDLTVPRNVAGGSLLEHARQLTPLSILKVELGNSRNDASLAVSCELLLLVGGALEKRVTKSGLLVLGDGGPVLSDQLAGLDGSQLAQDGVLVGCEDVDEGSQGLRGGVVGLVKLAGGSLDLLGVGLQKRLQQRNEFLFIHVCGRMKQ